MLIEALIVKGLVTAGHWLAAHGTSAAVTKGAAILVSKSVATQGIAATASAITGTAIVTGFVVGGFVWTNDLVQILMEAVSDLYEGKVDQAVKRFALLASKIKGLNNIELLPDMVEHVLERYDFSHESARAVAQFVRGKESDICRFAKLL